MALNTDGNTDGQSGRMVGEKWGLVDVLLLIETGLDKERVSVSLKNTFRRRDEMPVPDYLPSLPDSWRQPFSQMAAECGLKADFDTALNTVSSFWKEV